MSRGQLIIVSAPSGAGKTSLVHALLERDPNVVVSVSHTTRSRRPKEKDGVDYHFVDPDAFQALVAAGAFLEHAEVFGNRYGTSAEAVERELARGHDVVLEIDWQGARQVRARFEQVTSIFILPPSRDVLRERLTGRGADAPSAIAERSAQARAEMSHHTDYDFLVVNDDFETATADLLSIVRAQRLRVRWQRARLQALIDDLLSDL